jgi:hypothetical protein
MSDDVVPVLVKFFAQECHADQFIAGNLRLNRLGYFKKLEGTDGRPDANEAVATWWQPHDISIQFSSFPHLNITSKDLAAPVSTSFDVHDHLHIFCMSSVVVPRTTLAQPSFECSEMEVDEIRKGLTFDRRCLAFGEHSVIVQSIPFIDQLKKAVSARRHAMTAKLVKYYDDELFHGSFEHNEIPFRKQKRFAYQREFRVCIDTGLRGTTPLHLSIGKIEASMKVKSRDLNNMFRLTTSPIAA